MGLKRFTKIRCFGYCLLCHFILYFYLGSYIYLDCIVCDSLLSAACVRTIQVRTVVFNGLTSVILNRQGVFSIVSLKPSVGCRWMLNH